MTPILPAAITGFVTGLSLILAIGAQNAFVLRQGLTGAHVAPLCLFCATSDAILVAVGVAGFGAIAEIWPGFPWLMANAGAAFLIVYGGLRLHAASKGGAAMDPGAQSPSLVATIGTAAAFTWLNPHVYLDTLALLGAMSTRYAGGAKVAFGSGAVIASFVFFFALGYCARSLAPVMQSRKAWQVLDLCIGLTMWALAAALIGGQL